MVSLLHQVLEAALALPGVRSTPNAEQAARLAKKGCLPTLHERADIYLLLIDVVGKLNKGQDSVEAKKVGLKPAQDATLIIMVPSTVVPVAGQVSGCWHCPTALSHGQHECVAS